MHIFVGFAGYEYAREAVAKYFTCPEAPLTSKASINKKIKNKILLFCCFDQSPLVFCKHLV